MKRLILASITLITVIALVLQGNRIAARILDRELPPLLSRVLDLPVQIAPMKANLLQLKASSPRLVLGNAADPSVSASQVEVSLSLPHLLRLEVRLESASAESLMVRPSRWPSRQGPLPQDYRFLDPWLPKKLTLGAGSLVSDAGQAYAVKQATWQRHFRGGASAAWLGELPAGDVEIDVELTSLPDLLLLDPVALRVEVAVPAEPDSSIVVSTEIQPHSEAAYVINATLEAAESTARITATGERPWDLPVQSEWSIERLEPDRWLEVMQHYRRGRKGESLDTLLGAALPLLMLPQHRGSVRIEEIRYGDEIGKDSAFEFTTSEQGLEIHSISSTGPTGVLKGKLSIESGSAGWQVAVDATLTAREGRGGIAADFLDSDWLWRSGRAQLHGSGDSWLNLLNALRGDVELAGHYRHAVDTPVRIRAQLENQPMYLGLAPITIELGEGLLSGSARLSGGERYTLALEVKSDNLRLDWLFEDNEVEQTPGMAMPEFLAALPGLDLDWRADFVELSAPGLHMARAGATLRRNAAGGELVVKAIGANKGTLDLTLTAVTPEDSADTFALSADFVRLDLPELFRQDVLLHSRSSGKLRFQSHGEGVSENLEAMHGTADMSVDFRHDNDWQRAAYPEERLKFSGEASLVVASDRILGLQIDGLDIGSTEQDLTGDVSLVAGRTPWLIADLESQTLDVTGLKELLPESTEEADRADLLQSLHRLGAARVSLVVQELAIDDTSLSRMQLEIDSVGDQIKLKQLDFSGWGSRLESTGSVTWRNEIASLDLAATLTNFDLDQFLIRGSSEQHVPVSGSAKLHSEGSKVAELLANVSGHIDLAAASPGQGGTTRSRRRLVVEAQRLADGMQAEIGILHWGDSELTGSLRYHDSSPPLLDIDITGGSLSLEPWEAVEKEAAEVEPEQSEGSPVGTAASASASMVGNILLTPMRLLTGGGDSGPDEKFFSQDPLPLESLASLNMNVQGQLASVASSLLTVRELRFDGSVRGGRLSLDASVGELNGGSGDISLSLDTNVQPPTLAFQTHFENVRGLVLTDTYPRGGFASFTTHGSSPAALAAKADGLFYLELGRGPFDYFNSSLLTADIATTAFRTLIPGIDNQPAELECGVTVALFQDGVGITPYGFAARTNLANLLGRIELDLANERLQMSLDSRSRRGVGISLGSVFSNTIQIRGNLSSPRIVPNTTGILWRGAAAVMTAGLSVVGESLVKRVLASDNPCHSIKRLMERELCKENSIAASSPKVCPESQRAD